MIDGMWWLVILFAVGVALSIVAKSRGASDSKGNLAADQKPANDALQKTLKVVKQYFPNYRVARNRNHLLITQQGIKVAMITIDKRIAVGQRHLGGVPVINYHRIPSRAQLMTYLQGAG